MPEPIESTKGGTDIGPRDQVRDTENPDILKPPSTDRGLVPNLRFSFADAHMNLQDGGWSREVTQRELTIATEMAGVNMRLKTGGVRELHWHKQAEWSIMLAGDARITAVDNNGKSFIADVQAGDLWYFPAGIPHSIQGLGPDGCEFLLAFPDGSFSESSTFLLSEVFARTPKVVLAKNFGVAENAFDRIPKEQLFIFEAPVPAPIESDAVPNPLGAVPLSMISRAADQKSTGAPGGTVRVIDTRNFPIATEVAAAIVEVAPRSMREIHWHPNADEWQYYISGSGRMTVFASQDSSRTFDFRAGDVGYVPKSMSHYVENTGDVPLKFLELFRSSQFQDVSLNQWLALTPALLVTSHLGLDQTTIDRLSKSKKVIV
ncbi:MAG TPA: cupin domain-containing protein [Bryobacteraceae bacterium]|nr:cupin domain-containing protein [Bryobacteraceae bacterium]